MTITECKERIDLREPIRHLVNLKRRNSDGPVQTNSVQKSSGNRSCVVCKSPHTGQKIVLSFEGELKLKAEGNPLQQHQ